MKILLVEDSKRLQKAISTGLRKEGYAVDVSGDGEEGLWYAESVDYDVIIMDIMLPLMDGLTVLRKLRGKNSNVHVLMLTALDTVEDCVTGLKLGADDYLTKPFDFEELLARVEALIRRSYIQKNPAVEVGSLILNTGLRSVSVDGIPIELQPREYALLEYLALRKGQLVSRTEIEQHLYDENKDLLSNTIDSCICVIRRKLKEAGLNDLIRTSRGQGYILNGDSQ
jgi:two-component system, OmpR family, response regulator